MNEISKVTVVGAGYMGGGIAQTLALAEYDVRIVDDSPEATSRAYERLLAEGARFEELGLFAPGSSDVLRKHLHPGDSIEEAVADADFVEEAVPETREIKRAVLARISAAAAETTVIATNTSAIPVRELADAVRSPARFLAAHWMNPAPFIPGVEVIAGVDTDEEVVARTERLLLRAGKKPTRVADVEGFVVNRLQYALLREAAAVVEEGLATPADVDSIVSASFGFRLALFGPFKIADMAGLDTYLAAYRTLEDRYGTRLSPPALLVDLVQQGHHGVKSGAGFLGDYPESARESLVDYRNEAYSRLSRLLQDLAPGAD